MDERDILVVGAEEVRALLAGRELEVLAVVRDAYLAHADGKSSLPYSTFLRFPDHGANRIIALPAYLGDGFDLAGVKWISSFPGNVERGLARASAVLVLNSCSTGRSEAILEGSLPHQPDDRPLPWCRPAGGYDLDPAHADRAVALLRRQAPAIGAAVAASAEEVLRRCSLVSFATTALQPHVADLSICPPGATILHVSLRDLTPEVILKCDNIVDDADHVCRAQTSVHLAEQAAGSRAFIRCSLADVLLGRLPPRRDRQSIAVFSPFGLGILDLAVGKLVRELALAGGKGRVIPSFQPLSEPDGET